MQAGGRMRSELIEHFASKMAARGGRLHVMYGQTEAGPRMTTLPSSEVLNSLGSVGPALPGGRLEIRGDKGELLPAGETGEVVYFGPNVMMGYAIARKDLAEGYRMEDGLHTGDLGHLDARGYLTINGRANRFAKVHGVRVSLDEVEAMLSNRGPAAAVELEDNKLLVVVVESQDTGRIHAQLVDALRLPPASLVVRSAGSLPTKANGKIDYEKISRLP
jgi:acyl-coenzyme A synthetase/AMP-(fatty) acid ligase